MARTNILIVYDIPDNLTLLEKILAQEGYRVRNAPCGRPALQSIRNKPPDMILLDIENPNLDGYTLCNRLKADTATRNIPIIFVNVLKKPEDKFHDSGCVRGVDYVVHHDKTCLKLTLYRGH